MAELSVAHVGPDAHGQGGMATVQRALLRSSPAERHELVAITTHRPGGAGRRAAVFAAGLARLVRWTARPGPRVAHVHVTVRGSMHRKAVVVAVAKLLRTPVVLHVHAGALELERFHTQVGRVRRAAFRRAFAAADRVLAVSSASALVLTERYGAAGVVVALNPAPDPPDEAGPEDGAPEVLYLGGFANPVKGGAVLVEALPALRAAHPDARVTLAGPGAAPAAALDGEDGPIRWAGWLDAEAKRAALRRAHVVVVPSLSEGLPMALLEAMSHGRAVVATRVGGMPDVLEDGRDGVLVPPGDAPALARAIDRLLQDAERRGRFGEAARRRAAELSVDALAQRLEATYRELVRDAR